MTRAVMTPASIMHTMFGVTPATIDERMLPIWSETGPGMMAHAAISSACTKNGAMSCMIVPMTPLMRISEMGSQMMPMIPPISELTKSPAISLDSSISTVDVPTASWMSWKLPVLQISAAKRCASAAWLELVASAVLLEPPLDSSSRKEHASRLPSLSSSSSSSARSVTENSSSSSSSSSPKVSLGRSS